MKADADLDSINPAMILKDEQKIFVPEKIKKDGKNRQIKTKTAKINSDQNKSFSTSRININIASQEELETLKSIGPKRARAIIGHRKENGLFKNIEEIKEIKGIGEKIFENIKDKIWVGK